MKVALLPTGRTEWHGLAPALGRLFPEHEFYCLPTDAEVRSDPDRFPYPGFTSAPLTSAHLNTPPESARELVSRAAQEALGDRRRAAADLVFIIDDVELPNTAQLHHVVAVMRRAVEAHLSELERVGHHERTAAVLRQKVSFHLIAPMIEAWFFADEGALAAAGVPTGTAVHFDAATDPEVFVTSDQAYLHATEADCPTWAAMPTQRQKKLRPKWLGSQPRERHPKGYIQWLCRAPDERNCTGYSETAGGGAALAGLSWEAIAARAPAHLPLLRALVEDLADGLKVEPSLDLGHPQGNPPTTRRGAPREALLRNI
jgi:hypothetical protein